MPREAAHRGSRTRPTYESWWFAPGPFAAAMLVLIAISVPAIASVALLIAVVVLVLAFAVSRLAALRS